MSTGNTSSFFDEGLARRVAGMVNLALGKPACQSSLSEWSQNGEAARAVSGDFSADFAFHTSNDGNPWWIVDLGSLYPIEAIIIHNRVSGFHDRAKTLKVEIADQSGNWTLIHCGYAQFGARRNGYPFETWLGGELRGRYIRLSLAEAQYFHLSQVEVFARPDLVAFHTFCHANRLDNFYLNLPHSSRKYHLERSQAAISHEIVGLKINYSSRFGNLFQQYTHAIQIAKKTGLKYIQLGHNELFDVRHTIYTGGIIFLPPDAPLPADGALLSGVFFHSDDFRPLLSPTLRFFPEDEVAHSIVAQEFLRPHILTGVPLPGEQHFGDELTVHIRSGDIFSSNGAMNTWYRQPPFSFYTLVIEKMHTEGIINRVRMVFEDRGNPCIDRLEEWLNKNAMQYRVQCGTLIEDMSALIDAPHLIFGHGTFGYAVCRLSKKIQTVHFFAPELGGSYGYIPSIVNVFAVSDSAGRYIKAGEWGITRGEGEWRNTPEQRELMLTYPAELLQVDKLRNISATVNQNSRLCQQSM